MKTRLTGGTVYTPQGWKKAHIEIAEGRVVDLVPIDPRQGEPAGAEDLIDKVIPCDNFFIIPGLVDVHVHLREPGFSYKETIATGTAAAARGGYTTLCAMPNVDPAPWETQALQKQRDLIEKTACLRVIPYGRITAEPAGSGLAEMEAIWDRVAGFSDDGKGVQGEAVMRSAMEKVACLNEQGSPRIIAAHCEDERWPAEDPRSEWKEVERDLNLAGETGCPLHICHVSAAESVRRIRAAKADGVDVTCETAPHYLVFSNRNVPGEEADPTGGRFKMNPPLRREEDRKELIRGLQDGTIDMIATDHAPHSREEKSRGFSNSLNGIVGLETAFPVLHTKLVRQGLIRLEKLIDLMALAPRRRFGAVRQAEQGEKPGVGERIKSLYNGIVAGAPADLAVLDLETVDRIDPERFFSKGRSTPFAEMAVQGQTVMTLREGIVIYDRKEGIVDRKP